MPFFNMFKSRRARATSLPRAPERYLHESEVYNQASAYGPHTTSGFGRPARPAQPHAGFRAQRFPSDGSSFSNSVPDRYAESQANDESWYNVEHPDYSGHRGPRDRDPDEFSYSEEGDRHSDGTVTGTGVPIHTLSESTGTGLESPVPTVHRQGSPQSSSRMYEQFARPPRVPADVTRLDLHEGIEGGYDRHRRGQGRTVTVIAITRTDSHPSMPSSSPGMNVIFRDEYGNELKRVGDFSSSGGDTSDLDSYDEAPVELTDERGRVVYKRVGCDYPPRGKTGENYTDDGSDVTEATYRPQVVHLGQYVSNGRSAIPRGPSPITISLDRRGYHKHIQLDPSEDGSYGAAQETDRSFSPRLSHTRSESVSYSSLPPSIRSSF
ncbi:hypothetical protein BGY98DRAFT_1093188 [Russula aff. rugulosa BPL654]|nr:hypothetical protein BGY98DRAFT_1093188 [Russula aff. rugulosa BPL654]